MGDYDEKCDVWSMGVILYILICGAPPFYGPNDLAILESVKRGVFEFDSSCPLDLLVPVWATTSEDCKDLIKKMLSPATRRLDAHQVLEHPWFKKMGDPQTAGAELPLLVTKNLKLFRGAQKVKKAVLTYLATQLSEKEMEPLKKLFLTLDKNGDGILSLEEIRDGLKGRSDENELMDIMQSMDTDGSGFIDYTGTPCADPQSSWPQLSAKRSTSTATNSFKPSTCSTRHTRTLIP
jgi:calcium-dependent protein kinase